VTLAPFITCAVTGGGDTVARHPGVPVTPAQIAASAVEAARAGAAIVHLHVREPATGAPSREPSLFREAVELIRSSGVDAVVNVTTGVGGTLVVDADGRPAAGTDLVGPEERLAHVVAARPDVCTLNCASLNHGEAVYVSPPSYLRALARRIRELGVKPELEVFDLGALAFVRRLLADDLVAAPPFVQVCLGIPWGAPATRAALAAFLDGLPEGAVWTAFAAGEDGLPLLAQALVHGGNLRVGLEDRLTLDGEPTTNAALVARAVEIVERLGGRVAGPDEARQRLGLG
jgi:3-dehydrocarnitine:acetyl-CoA trimethylamine transferase